MDTEPRIEDRPQATDKIELADHDQYATRPASSDSTGGKPGPGSPRGGLGQLGLSALQALIVPALAVFTALVIGAVLIMLTAALAPRQGPSAGKQGLELVFAGYGGLLHGAFGSWDALAASIVTATPYIFVGLALALGFRAGLFNIGAEGQLALGSLAAAYVGFAPTFVGLPGIIHLPLALLAGMFAGAIWGFIPGFLKARRGAHEVITTIMLNYIAAQIVAYVLNQVKPGQGQVRTPDIATSAYLPVLIPTSTHLKEVHLGTVLALLAAAAVYWLLWRSTTGFELRTVGANPNAAKYAGISVNRITILGLTLSGLLAGLAGAVEVTGVNHYHTAGFSAGYGFDSITVALLGKNNPFGVVAAAFLLGSLKSGAGDMQLSTGIPIDIISLIQGLILLFVAADYIVRALYRVKAKQEDQTLLTRGWGG